MMIDLIGGPMDGDSVDLDGHLYPGMLIHVYNQRAPTYFINDPKEAMEGPTVLQYIIERVDLHVAFARYR